MKRLRFIVAVTLLLILFTCNVYGFPDVNETDWYYNDVIRLERQSIISGYGDGTFRPNNYINNGEALKMILESANISPTKTQGNHWASEYLESALTKSIIRNKNLNLDEFVTRESVADIIVNAFGFRTIKPGDNYFYDTRSLNCNILYELGVIKGVEKDKALYFYPNNKVTRAEIGAIIIRLNDSQGRKLLHPVVSNEEIGFPKEPKTIEELSELLLYMAVNNKYQITINYKTTPISNINNNQFKNVVSEAFNYVFNSYPEFLSATNSLSYNMKGTDFYTDVTYSLKSEDFTIEEIVENNKKFRKEAENILLDLIATGCVTEYMSERQKAKAIYDWIIDYAEYDMGFSRDSYTGYGLVKYKKAVCQGYTATYNYMSKLLGLNVTGISGSVLNARSNDELHMWTLINIGGNVYHIDSTWGDPGSGYDINKDYFFATSEFMKKTHVWDEK